MTLFKGQPTANPRQATAAVGCPSLRTHGTHGSRSTPGKPGGTYGSQGVAGPGSGAPTRGNVDKNRQQLVAQRLALEIELSEWLLRLRHAEKEVEPFNAAFTAAHEHCAWLLHQHGPGPRACDKTRKLILDAYDARMQAGHAAHPYRQAVKTASDVVGALRSRLQEIKEELE